MMIQTTLNLDTHEPAFDKSTHYPVEVKQQRLIKRALQCLEERIKYQTVSLATPGEVSSYLRLQLAQESNEVFAVMFLSTDHRVIAFEKLFFGTIGSTTVHPRVLIQRALFHNAAAVILAHNHPSGKVDPSASDQYLTRHLQEVLKHIDVSVLDHFIVSHESQMSFKERGLL